MRHTWNVAPASRRFALSTFAHPREPAMKTFTASPLFGATPFVSRVIVTPRTANVAEAWPVTVPGVRDVNVTVQAPDTVPGDAQVSTTSAMVAPPLGVRVTVADVPSGAFTNPAPSPRFWRTFTVNVWVSSMLFVSRGGPIVIEPSTNTFTASPEFGSSPSVSTWKTIPPPRERSAAACPVTVPALFDVNVTLHDPASVPGFDTQVLLETTARAPFVLVRVTVT